MTSRARVAKAINHEEPDRLPLDLGGSPVSGVQVSVVVALRQALGLPGPVKVVEPFQMLGEVDDDLRRALGVDTIGLGGRRTFFGFENRDWKPWRLFDGTEVLVPGAFNTDPEPNGDVLMYPEGDRSAPPSGRMPRGGFYFDAVIRQPPIDEAALRVEDNLEEFGPVSDDELAYFAREADRLSRETDLAIVANFGGTSFGDIALVPGLSLKHPKGIRDVEEWYVSTLLRRGYVYEVFARQCEIGLSNLERIRQAVGDRVSVVFVTGTDFGTQRGPFASPTIYRELYQPFHRRVNDWVHARTPWKTFIHTCGGVEPLIEDFIAAGFDILNPVQCSAAGMDPAHLKARYGDRITFWGGGVDTQRTLPFGTPEEVRDEVRRRIEVFAPGGGFVFNTIHNVQVGTPVENALALYRAVREHGEYGRRA
ncbi:MAG: methyltransferase [Armatimonadetes bacterium]|nr:methyltransferase [Armatimonadota bacterium]